MYLSPIYSDRSKIDIMMSVIIRDSQEEAISTIFSQILDIRLLLLLFLFSASRYIFLIEYKYDYYYQYCSSNNYKTETLNHYFTM